MDRKLIKKLNNIEYVYENGKYIHWHYRPIEGRWERHIGFLANCPICDKKYFIKFKDFKLGKGKKYCSPECLSESRKRK